jgi:hypothetical protein
LNDHELLELAAKAANLTIIGSAPGRAGLDVYDQSRGDARRWWSPLTDDGDALRLMVSLGMRVYVYPDAGDDVTVVANDELRMKNAPHISEPHSSDKLAATRRAIVRAAAEVGKNMTA